MAERILCLAGSNRKKSLNMQLARQCAELAQETGAGAMFIDLSDFPMPLYNGDEEAADGLPANVIDLQEVFRAHDSLLIASPEYNGSFSPLLKNTIDWLSRPNGSDDNNISPFKHKVAGLVAASPGGFGGLRGLVPLRMLLANIGVTVVHQQVAVTNAHDKINDNGKFNDPATLESLGGVIAAVSATRVDG